MNKYFLAVPLLIALFLLSMNCDTVNSDPKEEEEVQEILVGLIGKDPAGFWFFDTDSLALVDSLILDYTPSEFEVDYTNKVMYWHQNSPASQKSIHKYDLESESEITVAAEGLKLTLNTQGTYLVNYGAPVTSIYSTDQLNLVFEDSIGNVFKVLSSDDEHTFYSLGYDELDSGRSLLFHKIDLNDIENITINTFDSLDTFGLNDAVLSGDEKFLYLGYNWNTAGST